MRIAKNWAPRPLILALVYALAAYAQTTRQLPVQVLNVSADEKGVPVPKARVELVRDSTGAHISSGAVATDARGLAVLDVDVAFQNALGVRAEVSGAGDLVLYRPEEGEINVQQRNLTLKLLPRGSIALMDPLSLEGLISRLSKAPSSALQSGAGQASPKSDLTASLAEWAKRNGFRPEQVEEQLRQWSEKILKNPASATARQRALAEYASRNFLRAAELFGAAADADEPELQRDPKRIGEAEDRARASLRRLLDNKISQAKAFSAANHYTEARMAIERGFEKVDKRIYRGFWVEMLRRRAVARTEEGEFGPALTSTAAIRLAIEDNRQLLSELSGPSERVSWATIQNNLGIALHSEGERSGGAESGQLLAQAVDAYRAALEVYSKANFPQDWARIQNNLGNALRSQGRRSSGAEGAKLLTQAVVSLHAALEVRTKADLPQDWAATQNNIGIALSDQARFSSGAEVAKLLAQAADAYRAALEIRTRADFPRDWAVTQSNLGSVLLRQGELLGGAEGARLLAQAVDAYRAALEVRTKLDLPQNWAGTQNNLGNALLGQGERFSGAEGVKLLAQAVDAYRAALEVYTRTELPQEWAATQNNLGNALRRQGERSTGAEGVKLLAQAVDAYRAALEVRTKLDLPQDWAGTQNNLGNALRGLGERSGGAEGAKLLAQAVEAYRAALEVYTRSELPQGWATTQNNLGNALRGQGERSSGAAREKLLAQAADAYRAAMEVYTRADSPQNWARTQGRLAQALSLMEDLPAAATAAEQALQLYRNDPVLLAMLDVVYQDHLFEFSKAFDLNQRRLTLENSVAARLDFAEKHLTTARFAECLTRWKEFRDGEIDQRFLPGRDALRFACEIGAGKTAAARESAQALLNVAQDLQKPNWTFGGTKHFLAAHPAFSAARDAWIRLFETLENGDGPGLAQAVRTIQGTLKD